MKREVLLPDPKYIMVVCPKCRGAKTVNKRCPNRRCMSCIPQYGGLHREVCPVCHGVGVVPEVTI